MTKDSGGIRLSIFSVVPSYLGPGRIWTSLQDRFGFALAIRPALLLDVEFSKICVRVRDYV